MLRCFYELICHNFRSKLTPNRWASRIMIQRIALGYKYITPKGARRWSISCLFPIIPLQ